MPIQFSYELLHRWLGAEEARGRPELSDMQPHQRLLLFSDGSLTLDLELLYGSMVGVEVKFKGTAALNKDQASYLEEAPGERAMEREVWLTVDGKRLVYAHSLIPLSKVESGLLESLEKYSDEPLGRVLNANRIFFEKEKLEVGAVKSAPAALDLGMPEDTPFIARRYILSNREETAWVIKAAVTEIFSPEVISSPFFEKTELLPPGRR